MHAEYPDDPQERELVMALGVKAREHQLATAYSVEQLHNLVQDPNRNDGRLYTWRVVWWTNDNLDRGFPTELAGNVYYATTELAAHGRVQGVHPCQKLTTHSWHGWAYGQRVGVFIEGKLLPFDQPDSEPDPGIIAIPISKPEDVANLHNALDEIFGERGSL